MPAPIQGSDIATLPPLVVAPPEEEIQAKEAPAATEPSHPLRLSGDVSKLPVTVEVIGSIEIDSIFVTQTQRDKAIIGDIENATGFRRARIGARGSVGEQVYWESEFDFASGSIAFKNVYIAVDQLPLIREVRIGNFREPFSLEGQTSSNYFDFVERSPANSLDPARHWGVGFFSYTDNERATLAGGAFRSGSSGNTGGDTGDGNDMAYTFRVTALPWYQDDGVRLMHVGGAFSQQFPKNNVVTFDQGPQNTLLETSDSPLVPFVPTLTIPANQLQRYNLEWAMVIGSLSFQAEWNAAYVEQIGGGPVFLHGSYVMATFFLTGEHRAYETKYGTFDMTRVERPFFCFLHDQDRPRGCGAWELTCRLDHLNFDSPNLAPAPDGLKVGNRLTELTLGVNWYLNDNTRIMANYIHAVPVDPNFGPSGADAYFVRCAVFW